MMPIEGSVSVILYMDASMVYATDVASNRPFLAHKLLQKHTPESAVKMVSSLYRICANAQACASIQAMELALGIQVPEPIRFARAQMLRMETLREHVWRILLDWPVALGEKPEKQWMKRMLQIANNWQKAIDAKSQAYLIHSAELEMDSKMAALLSSECDSLLASAIFSMPALEWLRLEDTDDLLAWARKGETSAARLLNALIDRCWAKIGQSDVQNLPDMDLLLLELLLTEQNTTHFMQMPELDGEPHETTPCSRQAGHPLMKSLKRKYGNGLIARLTAVLIEVAVMYQTMREDFNDEAGLSDTTVEPAKLQIHTGIGVTEAARGRLIHRVRIQNDTVADYQIVAPTEWNFHPKGALARGMNSLKAGNEKDLKDQAKLLIHAMDPCVRFSLQVKAHA